MRKKAIESATVAVAFLVFVLAAGELFARGVPETFTNLEVLPNDITRQELVGIMRSYAGAVGGRCAYCHMVSDRLDQPTDDFATDEKATKRTARIMMKMVADINGKTLASLPERDSPAVEVTCDTCHGGIERPVAIEQEIGTVLESDGVDSAIARYRELRKEHFGSRAYDFSAKPLNVLAERLGKERATDAIRLLELNVEFHPNFLPSLGQLGGMHEANDDTESALRVYRGILELDPGLEFYDFYAKRARERIAALTG